VKASGSVGCSRRGGLSHLISIVVGKSAETLPERSDHNMRPSEIDKYAWQETSHREVQRHHLRVLKLHERVTMVLVRYLFDPERCIDYRGLGIPRRRRLRLAI